MGFTLIHAKKRIERQREDWHDETNISVWRINLTRIAIWGVILPSDAWLHAILASSGRGKLNGRSLWRATGYHRNIGCDHCRCVVLFTCPTDIMWSATKAKRISRKLNISITRSYKKNQCVLHDVYGTNDRMFHLGKLVHVANAEIWSHLHQENKQSN
jgi:hypothetical protein